MGDILKPFLVTVYSPFTSCLAFHSSQPSSSSHGVPTGLPGRLVSLTHVCQQETGNTDHSILFCPNISECFHIRNESLETPRHFLFMSAINYSPWYELQSRKAMLETRTEGWGWREADCQEKREKLPDWHWGSEEEINRVKRCDVDRWEATTVESELNGRMWNLNGSF